MMRHTPNRPESYRVGALVQHADAPEASALVGRVTRLLKPCVGAPFMVRVQWSERHSAPVNARMLRVVGQTADTDA